MLIVGLISGTSADGIDAALCNISGAPPQLSAQIIHSATIPYPAGTQQRIHDAALPEHSSAEILCELNVELGELFAAAGLGVVEPARERGIAGTDGRRGATDVIDHAALPWTTLLVVVAANPDTVGRLALRPVDADFVGLTFAIVFAIVAGTLVDDLDVVAFCHARV